MSVLYRNKINMKVKKVTSLVNTKENESWGLNRSIRYYHTKQRFIQQEKDISQENKKMFKRLYSILVRDKLIKDDDQTKGPNTLNQVGRKHELKRIMKSNMEILKQIKVLLLLRLLNPFECVRVLIIKYWVYTFEVWINLWIK